MFGCLRPVEKWHFGIINQLVNFKTRIGMARTEPRSKAWRRDMRNIYRTSFSHPFYNKALVRRYMRYYRKGDMFNPADFPGLFGTNPETWPKNRYQWRKRMGAKLLPYPKTTRKDDRAIIGK